MKPKKQKWNSRMQILIPMGVFVLAVIIALLFVIPSTANVKGITEKNDTGAAQEEEMTRSVSESAELAEASENTDQAVTDFFEQYYRALAEGNADAMQALYDEPVSVNAASIAPLIEGYDNLRVYTADGLRKDEMAAFVYSDVKFKNIETTAPSVDSFYLSSEDGQIKILSAMYSDEDIAEYLNLLAKKNPVRSIMENTEFWLQTTLQNDADLMDIYEQMQSAISAQASD